MFTKKIAGLLSALLLAGCVGTTLPPAVKVTLRPIPPAFSQEEISKTPKSVIEKVLNYFWKSQEKMDKDEIAIRGLQKP